MGCDYYGTKDDGKITFYFEIYTNNGKVTKEVTFDINDGDKIDIDYDGDIRER